MLRRLLRLSIALADRISPRLARRLRALQARQFWDPEIRLLPQLVDRDGSAVDVGAHLGVYTWPLARLVRQTYAVEPNPALARRLRQSFGAEVEVLACALSAEEGSAALRIPRHGGRELAGRASIEPGANPEFEGRPIEVPLRTLDSLRLDTCGFLKVHVEGHELAVLRGGRLTIERSHPTILVGAQTRFAPDIAEAIFAFLNGLGYGGYFLERGRLQPFAAFDPALHQAPQAVPRPGDRRGLTAAYVYNFIYVHPSRAAVIERLRPLMTEAAAAGIPGRAARSTAPSDGEGAHRSSPPSARSRTGE